MTDTVAADVVHELRQWAAGDLSLEAIVELLARAGLIGRYARRGRPIMGHSVWLDFPQAEQDLTDEALPFEDQAVVAVALSLVGHAPRSAASALGDRLLRIDRKRLALVLAAISHAAGTHLDTEPAVVHTTAGRPVLVPEPSLLGPIFPWPSE